MKMESDGGVRKRVQMALAVLLVAIAGAAAVLISRPWEPTYRGMKLSKWLASYPPEKTDEILRQLGSNCVPTLLRMLRMKDSAVEITFKRLVERFMRVDVDYTPAKVWNDRARHGFEVLGAQAKDAVPALIEIVNQDISETSRLDTVDALAFIGPPAEEAAPSFIQWATNANSELRCGAVFALGRIRSKPELAVPALINALHDSDPSTRIHALIALEQFGPDAKLAVPTLLEFNKTDNTTRSASALKAIAPDAAAKAGVK
jgi:HEAT repeat protein